MVKKNNKFPWGSKLLIFVFISFLDAITHFINGGSSFVMANDLGVNYQSFFPTPDQTDYITVHSTESVRAKKWRMHLFGSLSENNVFAYDFGNSVNNSSPQKQTISDQLFSGSLGVVYGITSNLEYGLVLPMNIIHNLKPKHYRTYLVQRGVTLIHNQFKYVFNRRGESEVDPSGRAVVISLGLPNTRQDGFLGDKQTPILTTEYVYDYGDEVSSYSYNIGYRWRSPGEPYGGSPVYPMEDQIIFSAAMQRQFVKNRKMNWIIEYFGSYPVDKGRYENVKDISTNEFIFGIRSGKSKTNRWTLGGGAEIFKGTLSPDWRFFAGWSWDFTWAKNTKDKDPLLSGRKVKGLGDDIADPIGAESFGPLVEDADRDSVIDDYDLCPRTPRGIPVDREGCPFDSDNDSIPDYEDQCPKTQNGDVVNSSGCPVLK